jgi:hypothetical protein
MQSHEWLITGQQAGSSPVVTRASHFDLIFTPKAS